MIVYVANVVTDSVDRYTYVYSSAPTKAQVIERVWLDEGEIADLDWYMSTTSVDIFPKEVLDIIL